MTIQQAVYVVELLETGRKSVGTLTPDEALYILRHCKELSAVTRKELEERSWDGVSWWWNR